MGESQGCEREFGTVGVEGQVEERVSEQVRDRGRIAAMGERVRLVRVREERRGRGSLPSTVMRRNCLTASTVQYSLSTAEMAVT